MICAIAEPANPAPTPGHAFYPSDKMERSQDGIATPVPAGVQTQSAEPVILEDGFLRVVLGGANGVVREVRHVGSDTVLFRNMEEIYELQSADKSDQSARESGDVIASVENVSAQGVTFMCSNPGLPGLTLRKTYELIDGLLTKRVLVESAEDEARLLRVVATMSPAGVISERGNAYGFEAQPPYFPETHEPLFWQDRWGPGGMRTMSAFVFPNEGVTGGVYTHTVQGEFVYARENDAWSQEKPGTLRSMPLVGGFVRRGEPFGYEFHLRVVPGDALDYYRAYQSLAGYRAVMSDQTDPAWFDRVRYVTDGGTGDLLGKWQPGQQLPPAPEPGKNILLGTDPENTMVFTLFGWGTLGGYPLQGEWKTYEPSVRPMNADAVRRALARVDGDSRTRHALYDWNCSFDPTTAPYPNHPDWIARDRHGNAQQSFFYGTAAYWPKDAKPNYLDPDYRAFVLGRLGRFPEVYGVRSLYLDAEVGDRYADWPSKIWFQPADRRNFLREMRRSSGSELPLIKNTPNAPYVSGGYWEGHGLRTEGMKSRWRALAGKLLAEKIWQWEHRWTALMKWGYAAPNEPYYSNYIVGLGFKPHAPDEPLRKAAYLQAAFEMRHLRLLNAKYSPCFWRNDSSEVEVYLLEQGGTAYASCISHEDAEKNITLRIQAPGLPFSDGQLLYIWRIDLARADQLPADLEAARQKIQAAGKKPLEETALVQAWISRPVATATFLESRTFTKETLEIPLRLQPLQLTMIAISPVPAIVLSEGDEVTKMPVPGTADVRLRKVEAGPESGKTRIHVESRRGCRIGLLESVAGNPASVVLEGKNLPTETLGLGGQKFVAVNVPPGSHILTISSHKNP